MFRYILCASSIAVFGWALIAQERSAIVYRNFDYGGEALNITQSTTLISRPLRGEVSSIKVTNGEGQWTIFWSGDSFDTDEPQLWVEGSRELSNLHALKLPDDDSDEDWGDRIRGVSFSSTGPWRGDRDQWTVCYQGRNCVNHPFRRIQDSPTLTTITDPKGWYVRVCPNAREGTWVALSIRHGDADADVRFENWYVWRNDGTHPTVLRVPPKFRFLYNIAVRASAPVRQPIQVCVGYGDRIVAAGNITTRIFDVDQDGRGACGC